MGAWLYTININKWSDYENADATLSDIAKEIVDELKRILPSLQENLPEHAMYVEDNIADFEEVVFDPEFDDVDEFDYRMSSLYDTGDLKVGNEWPPTTLIWIERK